MKDTDPGISHSNWDDVQPLANEFDFIHSRMLCYVVSDWKALFAHCWDHLAPGGRLEVQDIVMPVRCIDADVSPANSALLHNLEMQHKALLKRESKSLDITAGERLTEMLKEQGFENVKQESLQWAYGDWPKGELEKEIGRKHLQGVVLRSQTGLAQAMNMALFGIGKSL